MVAEWIQNYKSRDEFLMVTKVTRPKWVNAIFTPGLTVISTPLKSTWYVWMFVLLCLNDYHKISFLTEGRESSIRRLVVAGGNLGCHYDNMWCQWWRNFGLSTGRSFVRRAPFNRIFTPVLLWYLHHGNVYENFVYLFCYAWKLLYHYTCFFSHQKKRRRFHSFIVAGGTAFWHLTACGVTGDDGVALGLSAWRSLVFDARLT